jgi:predicted nucleic acid-binding protein
VAIVIDSSVFTAVERRGLPPGQVVDLVGAEQAVIASITASELLAGVYRADSRARRRRREDFVEAILATVPILAFDLRTARIHAQLLAQLTTSGRSIGAHDLLIGATALTHAAAVLTDNVRDFQRIPDLVVREVNW